MLQEVSVFNDFPLYQLLLTADKNGYVNKIKGY